MKFNSCSRSLWILPIVPALFEEAAILPFMEQINALARAPTSEFDLINFNGGSSVGSLTVLASLPAACCMRIANFFYRIGKEAVITAGLDLVRVDAVVPVDADLQGPIEIYEKFITESA